MAGTSEPPPLVLARPATEPSVSLTKDLPDLSLLLVRHFFFLVDRLVQPYTLGHHIKAPES
jgi:hypothetical protein